MRGANHCGVLMHHDQECADCADYDEGDCPVCGGDGSYRWGSWYREDWGLCGHCDEDKPISRMFDGSYPDERNWICFECYVLEHSKHCGCGEPTWKKWEVRECP